MPLEALGDTAGLYGRKCLVQRGRFVGVEIILHKRDLFSVREVVIGQITKYMGVINGSTPFANGDMTPTSKRREQHDFTGPEEDRALNIRVMSMEGKELWRRSIQASQLQPAEK